MNPVAAAWTRRPFARSADAAVVGQVDHRTALLAATAAIGVAAVSLRIMFGSQFDGLDDAGYLDAAQRIATGRGLENLFLLFRTRVGMAYPLGWIMQSGALHANQFWILTLAAECVTIISLAIAGWAFTGRAVAGLAAASLYAVYPLAIQQSMMFYPTAFQVASIAAACALVGCAERSDRRSRLALGFAAGLALGTGYLFKEDVAIVVPALALSSLIARFPRMTTAMAVCAGAAMVFGGECFAYWQATGHPLYRLTATSGLGAPLGNELQIAEIWRWDAFLRSLWLLPVQVGITWWLAIPAAIAAWRERRDHRGLFFVATAFVIVMAYLQFGSGSFSSYSPLPKTPRYTALATPLLILVIGAWLPRLREERPRIGALAAAAMIAAALPCLFYLQLSSSERTRNTLAVVPELQQLHADRVYTDYYSARVLRLLEPNAGVRVWYHANFDANQIVVVERPDGAAGATYVLLDRQAAKIYTSSYEMPMPPTIAEPPANWDVIWQHHAFEEGSLTRRVLEGVRRASQWLPGGNPLTSRINRSIADMIDGDRATLYRITESGTQ